MPVSFIDGTYAVFNELELVKVPNPVDDHITEFGLPEIADNGIVFLLHQLLFANAVILIDVVAGLTLKITESFIVLQFP